MTKKKLKTGPKIFVLIIVIFCFLYIAFDTIEYFVMKNMPREAVENHDNGYYNRDFGFLNVISKNDFNHNAVDDYADILAGAKNYIALNPKYENGYYEDGYPPDGVGVSTDLIWYSLKHAGYYLKDMIYQDILDNNDSYPNADVDSNIDFRRVDNQIIFFEKYCEKLDTSLDFDNLINFQPGDIVVFDYGDHIAIISDKRDVNGIPYLIEHTSNGASDNSLLNNKDMKITSHFRFTYTTSLQDLIDKTKKKN